MTVSLDQDRQVTKERFAATIELTDQQASLLAAWTEDPIWNGVLRSHGEVSGGLVDASLGGFEVTQCAAAIVTSLELFILGNPSSE